MLCFKGLHSLSFVIYIFQSQEVTYAELSLPRNKGYAPMRTMPTGNGLGGHCNNITPTPVLASMASMDPSCASSLASTGSDRTGGSTGAGQPPVIYARVDHAAKRNNTNLCMLNQAQTTVPLLISNISGGSSGSTSAGGQAGSLSGGGGVSPSSIMNTSCESSTSSGSASRLVIFFFFFLLGWLFFFA